MGSYNHIYGHLYSFITGISSLASATPVPSRTKIHRAIPWGEVFNDEAGGMYRLSLQDGFWDWRVAWIYAHNMCFPSKSPQLRPELYQL